MPNITLTGPSGDNPLGFLTALGALRALRDGGHRSTLWWTTGWQPVLEPGGSLNEDQLVTEIHAALHRDPKAGAEGTAKARKAWDEAKTAEKKKREEIKKRRLRGKEAKGTREAELTPLRGLIEEKRRAYLRLLGESAPDPSVTLGKDLKVTSSEFRDYCQESIEDASQGKRRVSDLCAAFGIEGPEAPAEQIMVTPFVLVSGSGYQDFLRTIQELMVALKPGHIKKALFGPWEPDDEKYSLRLDAQDDRRYALMDRDPTASGNKPRTLWGANLLAFEALAFFPCMPDSRGMAVAGWRNTEDGWTWRWPLWSVPSSAEVVRSLLSHPDCWSDDPAARARLRAMGCLTVCTSRRIKVGSGGKAKLNLTPGVPLW